MSKHYNFQQNTYSNLNSVANKSESYDPQPKLSKFYQVCDFMNPKTNKYHARKCIVNERNEVVYVHERKYNEDQYTRLKKICKPNQHKTYSTFDLDLIGLPSGNEIMATQSELLNNKYTEYGFAPI